MVYGPHRHTAGNLLGVMQRPDRPLSPLVQICTDGDFYCHTETRTRTVRVVQICTNLYRTAYVPMNRPHGGIGYGEFIGTYAQGDTLSANLHEASQAGAEPPERILCNGRYSPFLLFPIW